MTNRAEYLKEYKREWRKTYPDYDKVWLRKWRAEHPGRHYQNMRKWMLANPEKYRAHQAVQYALRVGKLIRQACQVCSKPEAHAHHPDYSKQLEVIWLCALCHKQQHKNIL